MKGIRASFAVAAVMCLSVTAFGQQRDCSERSCSAMFEEIFKDDACTYLAAGIEGDDELISDYVARFVMACTNWEQGCIIENERRRCTASISGGSPPTPKPGTSDGLDNNGCPTKITVTADGTCSETKVIHNKPCFSIKAGACKNSVVCGDDRGLFGKFSSLCGTRLEPGCGDALGALAEIRAAAYANYGTYLGRVNSAIASVLEPLNEEQKNSILGHIEGIEMYARGIPGHQCYETYFKGNIDWSDDTTSGQEEATQILVQAQMDGYESAEQSWAMPDASPSTIFVSGTVKNETGSPLANANVTLPDLGVTVTTNGTGRYLLTAEADGTEPFSGTWDFVLKKMVTAVDIEVTPPTAPLSIPRKAVASHPLAIRLFDCTDRATSGKCSALTSARVEVDLLNGDKLPFLTLSSAAGTVDATGSFSASLQLARPNPTTINLGDLWREPGAQNSNPFSIELEVRAFLTGETSPKKQERVSIPLNLLLIRGTTVDARLEPRNEVESPRFASGTDAMVTSQLSRDEEGVFYVLAQPSQITKDPRLMWKNTCNLQMNLPFSYLKAVRGLQPKFEAGAMIDIGIVDLLRPEEHEFRLTQWVREFLHALGFDNGQLGWAISSLSVLDVQYGVDGVSVPRYGMHAGMESMVGMAGVIQVGESEQQYWGGTAFADLDDTSYAIFLHELGHYVHKKIGDRWIEACLWDKKFAGIPVHTTWTTPEAKKLVSVERAKMMTSFFEGTADFFAYAMFKFVEANHPEMKDSLYFQRGYMKDFDTADKAMAVMHLGGCRVEGIKTSFFRELYEPHLATQPARAFGDLLKMMDAYKKESWIMRWVPARTITEWVAMKRKHGGLTPSSNLDSLVRKYTLTSCDTGIMAVPADPKAKPRIRVDGRTVTLEKQNLVQSLAIGQRVTVEQGMVTVILQTWDSDSPTTSFAAGTGTTFAILTADSVSDEKGTLVVDGKIAIKTEGGTITPSGTSFEVTVTVDGDAQARVVDGQVSVRTRRGESQFTQGQVAVISRRGKVRSIGNFDPERFKETFISPVEEAPEPEPQSTPAPRVTPAPTRFPATDQPGLTFLAVRLKATGQCVVVAGTEGISAGDTIYGSFTTYAEAQQAVTTQCGGGKPAATPQTPKTTPTPTPPASSEFIAPILALPKYDDDESTKGMFFFNLDTGNAFFIDKVKTSPKSVRTRTLNQNIFSALGRQRGTPALPGEVLLGEIRGGDGNVRGILLVDTSTGASAHITGLQNRSYEGRLQRISTKPAQSIASSDGNYVLVMKRDGSGKTEGAYLYHGSTGKALYFEDIHRMRAGQSAKPTSPLPIIRGRVSGLGLQAGSEATTGILLIDNDSGKTFHVSDLERRPERLTITPMQLNLLRYFPTSPDVKTPQRFVLIPITSGNGATDKVLVVDVGSGQMAILRDVRKPKKMRIQRSNQNLYSHLPKNVGRPRVIAAVPKVAGSGATEGAWLFDSASGEVLFLDNLDNLARFSIHRVDQRSR